MLGESPGSSELTTGFLLFLPQVWSPKSIHGLLLMTHSMIKTAPCGIRACCCVSCNLVQVSMLQHEPDTLPSVRCCPVPHLLLDESIANDKRYHAGSMEQHQTVKCLCKC